MLKVDESTANDEQLVKAIRQNDSEAFKRLYYKYFKPLIRFAWYRLYSMETVQDLVQETFLKVWINRQHLDPAKSIKAYLYKTLTNLIINYTKLHSSQTISLESLAESKSLNDGSKLELKLDIQDAVNRLPQKIKTVYMLSRYERFSYAEIAEICKISQKTVENRMSKAFNILRKTFPQKYFE